MDTSYDVRFWKTESYKGKRTTSYYVRWTVAGKPWREPFKNKALADSFLSSLRAGASRGEAFSVETGRPISMQRQERDVSWYEFACSFADMKWRRCAATTRRTHGEALMRITVSMLMPSKGRPDDKLVRHALSRWAFNLKRRNDPECPREVQEALRWIEKNTRGVSAMTKPEILRPVLDGLTIRLDGKPAAATVVSRQRRILFTAMEYAVEQRIIATNPIPALKWTAPKTGVEIDRRCVANPIQTRTLLNAVREGRNGLRLVAFFGCLYFAAMRPEEAVMLSKHNLAIPKDGWGELHLEQAAPHAGKEWTDSGNNRDRRQLKQRAVGEGRTVPCPPELTRLLNEHIERFGFAKDGRLFTGERNPNELPKGTINRAWREARRAALTPEVYDSPLAATPYDLRHGGISMWLVAGVPPADAARWAGQSIEVLYRIYASWLANSAQAWRNRIQDVLGEVEEA